MRRSDLNRSIHERRREFLPAPVLAAVLFGFGDALAALATTR